MGQPINKDSISTTNTLAQAALQQDYGMFKTADVIADTNAHTPTANFRWCAIQALADTVIAAWSENGSAVTAMATQAMDKGEIYYGNVTSLTLTSGKVRCYYAVNY